MKLMVPEVSLIRKLAQKETWRGWELDSVRVHVLGCWRVCSDTWFSSKLLQEVGIDNLISSAALFYLWGKKEHILQEKL